MSAKMIDGTEKPKIPSKFAKTHSALIPKIKTGPAYLINSLAFWKVEFSHSTSKAELLSLENASQKDVYNFRMQNFINRQIRKNCHLHKALNCILNFDALLNSKRLKDDLTNTDFGLNFELKYRKWILF